jgi:hypothetical protein
MTGNPTKPVGTNGKPPKPSSRSMAYLWIGIAAGFAFLIALYFGFVR